MKLEQTFRQSARHIDDIWPQFSEEERAEHKETMRRLRMCNPEYREAWEKVANNAALQRATLRRRVA